MARIVFSCAEGLGHVHPLIPLARGFATRGHDVVFVVPEGSLEWLRPYGFDGIGRPPGDGGPAGLRPGPWLAGVLEAVRRVRPALIVHDFSEPAAIVAGRVERVPVVAHASGPATTQRLREFRRGLRAAARIVRPGPDPLPAVLVDPCPDFLQHPAVGAFGRRIPISPFDRDFPAPSPRAGRDRAYVTVGTGSPGTSAGMVRTAVTALRRRGLPVLVSLGPNLREDTDTIRWLGSLRDVEAVEYAEHSEVLPRTNLVVCHGGSQTVIHSVAGAAWVVALPSVSDQFHVARALCRAGAGLWHHGGRLRPDRLLPSIDELASRDCRDEYPYGLLEELGRLPAPAAAAERVEEVAWG